MHSDQYLTYRMKSSRRIMYGNYMRNFKTIQLCNVFWVPVIPKENAWQHLEHQLKIVADKNTKVNVYVQIKG